MPSFPAQRAGDNGSNLPKRLVIRNLEDLREKLLVLAASEQKYEQPVNFKPEYLQMMLARIDEVDHHLQNIRPATSTYTDIKTAFDFVTRLTIEVDQLDSIPKTQVRLVDATVAEHIQALQEMRKLAEGVKRHNAELAAKLKKIDEKAAKASKYTGVSSPSAADAPPALASDNPAPPSDNLRLNNRYWQLFRQKYGYRTIKTNWSLTKVRDKAKESLRRASRRVSPLASVKKEIRDARRRLLSSKRPSSSSPTAVTLRPRSPNGREVASPMRRLKGLRRRRREGASAKKGAASKAEATPEKAEPSYAGLPFGPE